jgi:hypothetical protein
LIRSLTSEGNHCRFIGALMTSHMLPMRPYPNVPLQGQPRPAIGDQHPSGYTVGTRTNKRGDEPAVSPDHIVPKVEILFLPRFLDLTPDPKNRRPRTAQRTNRKVVETASKTPKLVAKFASIPRPWTPRPPYSYVGLHRY